MKRIQVLLNDTTAVFEVYDDELVFDGSQFIKPENASYIQVLAYGYADVPDGLSRFKLLKVLNVETVVGTEPSQDVVVEVDPSNGECVCGLTCHGTNLKYVQVTGA